MDTVLDRLQAAGLSDERIQWHLDAGTVRLDGEVVTDPSTPAPWPARIVLWSDVVGGHLDRGRGAGSGPDVEFDGDRGTADVPAVVNAVRVLEPIAANGPTACPPPC
jgi:hypothetical protein